MKKSETYGGKMSKKKLCAHCKKERPLQDSVRKARIEDIEDGAYIDIPNPICGKCLQAIAKELEEL